MIDYKAILDEAWQQHLKPKEPNATTVISLFAGGGGSSLGYSMAGYRELLAVEWDNNAIEIFKVNFPDVQVYHGDIVKLSVEECTKLAGLSEPGELDLLDGSPPCQGFSTAGKRILDDSRNQLFREYIRLLRGLKPKVFVMENVSGLVKGKMKLVFAEIMRELKASGYRVSARLMNTMYFYVPQSRQRVIFIGVREDLGIEPGHPGAESRAVTVREGLSEVKNKTFGPDVRGKTLKILKNCKPGQEFPDVIKIRKFFSFIRLSFDKPSNVIPKSTARGGYCYLFHPIENRGITLDEMKRLHSYGDNYKFTGFTNSQFVIGNSVPPLFMRSIANYIKQEILAGTMILQ